MDLFQKYKVPGAKDIPTDFRVYIKKNGDNPLGILRSKGKIEAFQPHTIITSTTLVHCSLIYNVS